MKKLLTIITTLVIFAIMLCFSASAAKISAPKTFKATTTSDSITLSWSKVSGADGYRIYYRTSTKGDWKYAVKSTKKTAHTFNNLTKGKKYYFAIKSYDKTKSGTTFSSSKKLNTATQPVATSKLNAKQTIKTVKLTWSAVKGATHYRIYQKINGEWTPLCYTTKTGKTIKNLKSDTSYTFAVRSYIKTKTINVAGGYKIVNVKTNRVPGETYVAKTDKGLKLYEVTSDEAKNIKAKYGVRGFTYYEAKSNDNKILLYTKTLDGIWYGYDINGVEHDASGNVVICSYCDKIMGKESKHCNGSCHFTFS